MTPATLRMANAMREDVILTKLKSVESELKNLTGAVRTHGTILQNVAESISDAISRQVFTVKDLAVRWNCSEIHARQIIMHYRIPLVLGKNHKPRKPLCVLRSELVKYENSQSDKRLKTTLCIAPVDGKTARGFVPFQKHKTFFTGGIRLGDLRGKP